MRLYLDTNIITFLIKGQDDEIDRHNDPNDRLIIAQAISDKATLVSSDLQFPRYRKYGLTLHQNRR